MRESDDRAANQVAVCSETGPNESLLIGTKSQLKAFAQAILQTLDEVAHEEQWHGVAVQFPRISTALTDGRCRVAVDGLAIVETEGDRRALINRIRVSCSDNPIDWST